MSLLGTPMIGHVVARAREAGCFDAVIVATDDARIADAARAAGAESIMTGEARSGTDRIALALGGVEASVVVNVQGDEPTLPPDNLRTIVAFLRAHPEAPIATLSLPAAAEDLANPNLVKVVCDLGGRALYFSRAAIPFPRHAPGDLARKHVGLYGFQRAALDVFTSWPESPLEKVEALEQLRAIEHGMPIHVLAAAGDSVAVDTPADVPRAEAALRILLARAGRS